MSNGKTKRIHTKNLFRLFSVPCFTYQVNNSSLNTTPCLALQCKIEYSVFVHSKYTEKLKPKPKPIRNQVATEQETNKFNSIQFTIQSPYFSGTEQIIIYTFDMRKIYDSQFTQIDVVVVCWWWFLCILSMIHMYFVCVLILSPIPLFYFIRYDSLNTYFNCISFVSILLCGFLFLLFYRRL